METQFHAGDYALLNHGQKSQNISGANFGGFDNQPQTLNNAIAEGWKKVSEWYFKVMQEWLSEFSTFLPPAFLLFDSKVPSPRYTIIEIDNQRDPRCNRADFKSNTQLDFLRQNMSITPI